MSDSKITVQYFCAVVLSVLFTWLIHEYAHWLMGDLLGYESIMRINGTSYIGDLEPTDVHRNIVSAAGPIITILQGIVAFFYLKIKGWNKYIYPLVFIAFYMRLAAGLLNFVNLNDEGRISEYLGIGTFTLSILVCSLLFYLVYSISKRYEPGTKFQIWTTVFVIALSTILIMADMHYGVRII